MDKKKKIIYGILISVSVLISAIIYFMPEPGTQTKGIIKNPKLTPKNVEKDVPKKSAVEEELIEKEVFKGKKVQRDIFSSKLLDKQVEEQETRKEKEKSIFEVKRNFKIQGIAISENSKSVILNTSEILDEGDKKDGFLIMKIQNDTVIMRSPNGEIIEVNLWEEN